MPYQGLGLNAYLWNIDHHKYISRYAWGGYVDVLQDNFDADYSSDDDEGDDSMVYLDSEGLDSDEDSSGWDSSDGDSSSHFNPEEESDSE
ncbi:hypothetical protein HK104_006838 [Borealophlyctis nickersoniae]|nr:hypothetical protein HK104_006838 [Borealophlyctis nickersoniae]